MLGVVRVLPSSENALASVDLLIARKNARERAAGLGVV